MFIEEFQDFILEWFGTWQDFVLTVGQLIFSAALLPSILSEDKPSYWTSLINAAVLVSFTVTFYSLELTYSASVAAVNSCLWIILFVQKRFY